MDRPRGREPPLDITGNRIPDPAIFENSDYSEDPTINLNILREERSPDPFRGSRIDDYHTGPYDHGTVVPRSIDFSNPPVTDQIIFPNTHNDNIPFTGLQVPREEEPLPPVRGSVRSSGTQASRHSLRLLVTNTPGSRTSSILDNPGSLLGVHRPYVEDTSVEARRRWVTGGRLAKNAFKVMKAFIPVESRFFRYGRLIGSLWADHAFIWPFRDVRFFVIDGPSFSSFSTLLSLTRTFFLLPLHLLEDICEHFHDTQELLENTPTPDAGFFKSTAFTELLTSAFSWPLYSMHQRLLHGLSIGSPSYWIYGLGAHLATVLPFLGVNAAGLPGLLPFTVPVRAQTFWLLTMCKPLDVLAMYCAKNYCHEFEGIKGIVRTYGYRGFFRGTLADLSCLTALMCGYTLAESERPIPKKVIGAVAAINTVILRYGNWILREFALISTVILGTAIFKRVTTSYFGPAPLADQRREVERTTEFLKSKEIANKLLMKLSDHAENVAFQPSVDLNRSWEKRISIEFTVRPSMAAITKRLSQMIKRPSQTEEAREPPCVYLSGFMDDLLGVNGQFDLYQAIQINARPVYRKDVGDDSFLYLLYDDWQKWVLTNSLMPDPPFIVAYCQDTSEYPHHCQGIWQIAEKNGFIKDTAVKVSREPTLFLRRMSVFSTLNAMIEEGEVRDGSDIDKAVEPADSFILQVRRDNLVKSSFLAILGAHPSELVARDFSVKFLGEDGLDYGGVRREWFALLANELIKNPEIELQLWNKTIRTKGGLFTKAPDRSFLLRENPIDLFVGLGRILAMALIHEAAFPLPLCFIIFKYLLKNPVNAQDVRALDLQFYQFRLATLLAPGGAGAMEEMLGEPLTFISAASQWGTGETPLVAGGEFVSVTEQNKMEYARLLTEDYLCGNIRHQLQALVTGFWDLCPLKALKSMDAKDLQALVMGPSEPLDIPELQRNTNFQPDNINLPQFDWFFEALKELSSENHVRLVQFVTGSPRIPDEGLRPPFTLVVNAAWDAEQLPIAHTCANMICIPAYPEYRVLFDKLHTAVVNNVGFGFA